jgi:hypothetical protein
MKCEIMFRTKYLYFAFVIFRNICENIKGKVKLILCFFLIEHNAMKAYWGSGITCPRILDLGTRWR